jgi:hypothetical protein
MKIMISNASGARFVLSDEEASVLGEYVQLSLAGNWWVLKPVDKPSARVRRVASRRIDAKTYRLNYSLGSAGIAVKPEDEWRSAKELETKQNGPGYMMRIPDQFIPEKRVAERRDFDFCVEDLQAAVSVVNQSIEAGKAEGVIRDGKLVVRAVMELV